jgi:hypothetical protein
MAIRIFDKLRRTRPFPSRSAISRDRRPGAADRANPACDAANRQDPAGASGGAEARLPSEKIATGKVDAARLSWAIAVAAAHVPWR